MRQSSPACCRTNRDWGLGTGKSRRSSLSGERCRQSRSASLSGARHPREQPMPRVKRGTVRRAKRKKLLGLAKGYYANKSKLYRAAKESVDTALKYAFVGRRPKKRDFRRLWVVRINAAARLHGLTYGQFINGLKNAGVTLDRKSLSEIAISSPAAFATLAKQAKADAKAPARA